MEKRPSITDRHSSIISLQSSSLFSQENQEIVDELAEKLQTDGTKVPCVTSCHAKMEPPFLVPTGPY